MSRSVTAALSKMALEERLPLFFRLRAASVNPRYSRAQRAKLRLAARSVWASLDSAEYDMILRLQILEGMHTGEARNLSWFKNPRRGLAKAEDAFSGKDINPEWFSRSNTGLVKGVLGAIKGAAAAWARQYGDIVGDWEGLFQNAVMGLGLTGEPLPAGYPAGGVGAKQPQTQQAINNGAAPKSLAGNIARYIKQKFQSSKKRLQDDLGSNVLPEGGSVFDMADSSALGDRRSFMELLADAVQTPNHPVRNLILDRFEREFGDTKFAQIGAHVLINDLTGVRYTKQDLAREYGISPGTLSKALRTKLKPAIERVKKDKSFLRKVEDMVERTSRRASQRRLAALRAMRKQGKQVDPQKVVQALGLLRHHQGIKPVAVVEGDYAEVKIPVGPRQAMSMARAYIENHLDEQLGSSAKFEVTFYGDREIVVHLTKV